MFTQTKKCLPLVICLYLLPGAGRHAADAAPAPLTDAIPVSIHVHATNMIGELKPIWRFFGADEPNYAYMKNGEKLLAELGELRPRSVYFRAHNLLTSGDG